MEYTKKLHEKLRLSNRGCICCWKDETDALLDEIERLQSLIQWVPVECRLPEVKKDTLVLCVTYYKHSDQQIVDTRTFWADSQLFSGAGEVTHWMPLPLPPEGVK